VVAFTHNIDVGRAAFVSIYMKVHSSGPRFCAVAYLEQIPDRPRQGPPFTDARIPPDRRRSAKNGVSRMTRSGPAMVWRKMTGPPSPMVFRTPRRTGSEKPSSPTNLTASLRQITNLLRVSLPSLGARIELKSTRCRPLFSVSASRVHSASESRA
jgi:hypothetical protein